MAAAPLLAGAASLASPPLAVAGLLGLATLSAGTALPLLCEQHDEVFGAWRATLDTSDRAAERGWTAVIGPEVYVFSSYRWSVLHWRGDPVPPMVLTPRAPETWAGVDRPWLVATVHPELYWPSLTGSVRTYGRVSDRLQPLTQRRFLSAAVIDNPPLPVGRWWTVEHLDDGRPFMWAGAGAELWLPPVPAETLIGVELRPAPGAVPLAVDIGHGGGRRVLDGRAPASWLWTRTTVDRDRDPVIVRLERSTVYPPGGGDSRGLSAQLLGVVVRPPGSRWHGSAATPSERAGLGLELDGAYDAEVFADLGRGVWLAPSARFRLTVDEPGTVTLRLAAPRPTPAAPRVVRDGTVVAGPVDVDEGGCTVAIEVDDDAVERGVLEFELVSEPYLPAAAGSPDARELGVVLRGLEFEPVRPSDGWWNRRR
jgi:hypothetical protein